MGQDFEVSVVRDDDGVTLVLSGELDLVSVTTASAAINAIVSDPTEVIILDLADLNFLNAAGVSPLVRLTNAANRAGCRVVALYATPVFATVINLTGIELVDPQRGPSMRRRSSRRRGKGTRVEYRP